MRLRNVVFTSLIMCSVAAAGHAQAGVTLPRSRFGITAGVNWSTVAGDDVEDAKRKTGLMAGGLVVLPVAPSFSIQPELLYTMKGAGSEGDGDFSVKINYIEIPVLARFDIQTTGGAKPFIYGGPSLAFKVGCSVEGNEGGVKVNIDCDDSNNQFGFPEFKSFDYGLVIGGGLAFDVSGKTLSIGARYNHGLGKVIEDSDAKNRVISILASIEFPWGK